MIFDNALQQVDFFTSDSLYNLSQPKLRGRKPYLYDNMTNSDKRISCSALHVNGKNTFFIFRCAPQLTGNILLTARGI
jgi:hypothetical protein